MKKVSMKEGIEKITRKYFKYSPLTLFEKVLEHEISSKGDLRQFAECLMDISYLLEEYQEIKDAEVNKLKTEIKLLRQILNKNTKNSHKAPSSDQNRKIKNSRQRTEKKQGGQKGHEGHAHELSDVPDAVHRYEIHKCIECGCSLTKASESEVIRKQTVEIKDGKTHITEYQTIIKFCPRCGRWNRGTGPEDLQKSRVIFGPNVKSISVYLLVQQLLPYWRTQEVLFDLFGVPISQGTLCRILKEYSSKLLDWESETKQKILASPHNHVDETGIRCEKRTDYAHVISNSEATLLFHHQKRGITAMVDIGILPEYKGNLVHDFFSAYWGFGSSHAICNAHLLRELKFAHEEDEQGWALSMAGLLKSALHDVHCAKNKGFRWKLTLKNDYLKIIKSGYKEVGFPQEWKGRPPDGYKIDYSGEEKIKIPIFKRRKNSKSLNLLNRFRDYLNEILAFAMKPGVPFTNNQAERDFRFVKLKQKISGCFRSKEFAADFLRIRAYLNTLRKNNMPLLENLVLIEICC